MNEGHKEAYCDFATTGQPQDLRVASDSFLGVAIKEVIMNYQFNVELATEYGVDEAIMIHNIIFWLRKNKANNKNFINGRTWTYNSADSFCELFPFWNRRKIARVLQSLEDKGIIVSGNHNKVKYDRTKWYALSDESLLELPLDKNANGNNRSVQPIPDSKQDCKQDTYASQSSDCSDCDSSKSSEKEKEVAPESADSFYSEEFLAWWEHYPRKVGKGSAFNAFRRAKKRPPVDELIAAVEARKNTDDWTKDGGKYIPHPSTWINSRGWEDELEPAQTKKPLEGWEQYL